jgi:hypothetical protein
MLQAREAVTSPRPDLAVPPRQARWSLPTRVAFRFCFLYFGLYVLTTQMLGGLWILPKPQPPDLGATGWMRAPVAWTATHLFRVPWEFVRTTTGSGDKTIDWVHAFLLVVFSVAATLVWSALDRRRPDYAVLHKWFHLFLRFAAGTTMVGYGMAKAIPLQMPAPQLTRLLERYGDFSPMGVLWYSIGASFPYERFAGAMELTAAVLLFIPRLSMLGAMVLVADSVQIFTLNMTYDIPVKLFSFHLILMGLVLLAPEMRRLANVLVLNRAVGPSTLPPLVRGVTAARVLVAAQLLFGACAIGTAYADARTSWNTFGAGAAKPPLYGIWNVEKMEIDGVERAPLLTDYDRWRRVIVQNAATLSFQRMDDSFGGYPATTDPASRTIALSTSPNTAPTGKLRYEQPSPDVLILTGTDAAGRKLHLVTRLFDRNRFLLVSRGFHWIQERPFNR